MFFTESVASIDVLEKVTDYHEQWKMEVEHQDLVFKELMEIKQGVLDLNMKMDDNIPKNQELVEVSQGEQAINRMLSCIYIANT